MVQKLTWILNLTHFYGFENILPWSITEKAYIEIVNKNNVDPLKSNVAAWWICLDTKMRMMEKKHLKHFESEYLMRSWDVWPLTAAGQICTH